MRHYTFSIRCTVNGGCSGICLMCVSARGRRAALTIALADLRKMGKRNFCIAEVR